MLFRRLIRNRIGHTERPAHLKVVAAMLAAILLAVGLVGIMNFLTLFEVPPPGKDTLRVILTPALPVTHCNLKAIVALPNSETRPDTATFSYCWYKNTVLQPALNTDTVDASYVSKDDTWRCEVTPTSGLDAGLTAAAEVTILNSPPTTPKVAIASDVPIGLGNLVCYITKPSSDRDNDPITYSYAWFKNDVLQPRLTTNVVEASHTSKNDVWKCELLASDGRDGSAPASDEVTIINAPPTSPVVHVTPDSPTGEDALVGHVSQPGIDPAGDTTSSTGTLDQGNQDNSPPTTPVVKIAPGSPFTTDNLVCSITAPSSDPEGDPITYVYQWYKNNVLQPQLTTDTVPSSYIAEGEVWRCVVTASDGTTASAGGSDEVTVSRRSANAGELAFSGYTWTIRSNPGSPGPNSWSSSNAWVDAEGHLHLKLSNVGGAWYCAEVTTTQVFGFGTYQFTVNSRVDLLDKNVVLGLFVYTAPDTANEIDIEFARWGNASYPNGNFTVWPAQEGLSPAEYTFLSALGDSSTHQFTWTQDSVSFSSSGVTWSFSPSDYAARISSQPMPVFINLWLFDGNAPSDGKEVEIEITEFKFTPA